MKKNNQIFRKNNLKEKLLATYRWIFLFIKEYYLIFIIIVFFILKTHVFNMWTGLTSYFPVRRTLSAFGLILIISAPAFLMPRKKRFIYLLTIIFLTSSVFASQYIYNSYGNGFFSFSALKYFFQLAPVTNIIWKLLNWKVFLFFIDLIVLIFIYLFFYRRNINSNFLKTSKRTWILFFLSLLLGIASSSYNLVKERSINYLIIPMDNYSLIQKVGIVNYSIQDFFRYYFTKRKITPQEIEMVKKWSKERIVEDGKNLEGIAKGKNIIILQLESFQDFLIDLKIDNQEVTPNLNKLANQSYRFNNFYYQSGPGTTSDAEFTTLNSLFFLPERSIYFDYPLNKYYALPKFLNEKSYYCAGMHGYRKGFWNRSIVYPNLGFNNFYHVDYYKTKDQVGWGLADEDFLEQSAYIMKDFKKPFFSFILTLSTHGPFNIPKNKQELKIEKAKYGDLITDYFQSTHYADKSLGIFINKLKELGLYENSLLIIYGDHEGYLGGLKNENFRKLMNFQSENYPYNIEIQKVPFIIHLPKPNIEYNLVGKSDIPASQLDVYPTLINLLGEKTPKTTLGQDLFNTKDPFVLFRRNTVLNNSFMTKKFFYQASIDKDFQKGTCYDLSTNKKTETNNCLNDFNKANDLSKINDVIIYGNKLDILNE